MLVVKQVVKLEDGSYDTSWNIDSDQMAFLVTFAINALVNEGLMKVETKNLDKNQLELSFLNQVDINSIPQA